MPSVLSVRRHHTRIRGQRILALTLAALAVPVSTFAAGSPWENAVAVLAASFTGPIARGLSLVAVVLGGIMFAFQEGDSKRALAGIVFGVGMAVSAANFMVWLFGYPDQASRSPIRQLAAH